MKIIVVSDMVAHKTGYGVTAKALCLALKRDGHQVYNYAPGAFHFANLIDEDGIAILGSNGKDDRWGNQTLKHHLRNIQPDLVIAWLDPQGLAEYGLDGTPYYIWAPIDSWPVPENEIALLGRATKVFACSKWGQQVLKGQHLDAGYVPCGIDLKTLHIDPAGRERWRGLWGIRPEQYVVGMVGINGGSPDRKGYGYAFDILARFLKNHPDSVFYIHTDPDSDGSSMNLRELAKAVGIQDAVRFPDYPGPGGYPEHYMRDAYNGMDVLLHTSLTEGFGMPVIEAQACGTPVVANAATSVTELVPPRSGMTASPLTSMWVGTVTRIAVPDVDAIYSQLEQAYHKEWNRSQVRLNALQYDFDRTYQECWKPLIDSVPEPIVIPEDARKLRLGAGKDNDPAYVNHDKDFYFPHIDVAHDLNVFPYPWEDDSFDYIEMSDVMEHLTANVTDVMDELHRILAPGGHLFLHTVKAGSWQHTQDPTHTRGFEVDSFDYYDPMTEWGAAYRYSLRTWEILKKTIAPNGGVMLWLRTRKPVPVPEAERETVTA